MFIFQIGVGTTNQGGGGVGVGNNNNGGGNRVGVANGNGGNGVGNPVGVAQRDGNADEFNPAGGNALPVVRPANPGLIGAHHNGIQVARGAVGVAQVAQVLNASRNITTTVNIARLATGVRGAGTVGRSIPVLNIVLAGVGIGADYANYSCRQSGGAIIDAFIDGLRNPPENSGIEPITFTDAEVARLRELANSNAANAPAQLKAYIQELGFTAEVANALVDGHAGPDGQRMPGTAQLNREKREAWNDFAINTGTTVTCALGGAAIGATLGLIGGPFAPVTCAAGAVIGLTVGLAVGGVITGVRALGKLFSWW